MRHEEHAMNRYRYTRRNGKTFVSCTRCGENLVPAPTTFEEDPICWECCPLPAVSERTHFARLVAMLCAAEAAVVCTLLGWDGIAKMYRLVWDMITPW
ncbi:hypothetical protein ABZ172_11935 [Streptomyces sp. NPDC006296]|uniref:hypothetical protein n=1 Tax=Streptomyces sp. NPDC006296 TaxID=3156746 RepID=UPI0033A219A4